MVLRASRGFLGGRGRLCVAAAAGIAESGVAALFETSWTLITAEWHFECRGAESRRCERKDFVDKSDTGTV